MPYYPVKADNGSQIEVYIGGIDKDAVNVILEKGYSGGNEVSVRVKDEESGKKLAELLAEVLV